MTQEERERMIAEIERKMELVRIQCHGWLTCQDGSYEMALHECGYDNLARELRQLKEQQ